MTLEDFFTLTEMKDGITSHTRVEELISVMQKEKDSVVKNAVEAARQWSTVANTLVATENRESLDHFVRLDGLCFLDRWLQEAQKFNNETCDASVEEESITLLLGVLKKLPIDSKNSTSSGIGVTVEKLFAHKSSKVQEKARALFDGWSQGRDDDHDQKGVEEVVGLRNDRIKQIDQAVATESGSVKDSFLDNTLKPNAGERNNLGEPMEIENKPPRSLDDSQSDSFRSLNNFVTNIKDGNNMTLNQENKEVGFRENVQDSSSMLITCQGKSSATEESSTCPTERVASMGICSRSASVEWRSSDILKLKDFTNETKEKDIRNGSPDEMEKKQTNSLSASSAPEPFSSADPANIQHPVKQPDVLSNNGAKETGICIEKTLPAGADDECTLAAETDLKIVAVESGKRKHLRTAMGLEGTDQVGVCNSDVFQKSSSFDACTLRKSDSSGASFSGKQDIKTAHNVEELADESTLKAGKGYETSFAISKAVMDGKVSENNKKSDMDFDYGEDDALEVARQVAKAVEREVVDYREQFGSSASEKNSEGGVMQPDSPDSINGERDQSMVGPEIENPISQDPICGALPRDGETPICGALSPSRADNSMNSEHADKTEDCTHKVDSSESTENCQETVQETKKGLGGIDLNELCSEEMDNPTITFVSASKVTPAGIPMAPFHFEGELGWKGSAATSAFRPASARRTPDGEKPLSVEGSSQSSKQRQGFLDFDLNVAEGYGDGLSNPALGKQIPVSSELPSGESSIEVSSMRAKRLKLDLNRVGDNEDTPSSDCRMEEPFRYQHPNGSPSPASSSSSRQFPMRNIDLNGNPSFFDDSSEQRTGFGKYSSSEMNTSGGFKVDDPVVSILGTRVAINRTEGIPQTRSFLPNGHAVESPVATGFTRSDGGLGTHHQMAYTPAQSSVFGYNSFSLGSSVALSPASYGPGSAHCMVDSRGFPVIPQMMPSSSDVPPSQQSFLMSMRSPLLGFNGDSRASLDLNSGMTMVEAESRETEGLRPLFFQGTGVLMEEQMRSASQSMGSGIGAKRKEPDGGWDPYPVGYKHHHPWR
ncbi:hypothetical protein IFM89_034026 [Coptis chinensis]|uniref:TFIIS N-terminal domain-containing protein n=1 Tax=Coptis chinensis TaxID=261450 RepID=A0A835ISC6_9MAGN|nr:hypothetical protein IFM89_034026 [Coptis chinensis]